MSILYVPLKYAAMGRGMKIEDAYFTWDFFGLFLVYEKIARQ